MRTIVATMVLVMLVAGLAVAAPADVDEAKLSPEAKALKAKYDAQIKALQDEFMTGRVHDRTGGSCGTAGCC